MPTKFTDVSAEQQRIDEAIEEKERLITRDAEAEIELLRARNLYHLFGLFREVENQLNGYTSERIRNGSDFFVRLIGDGRDASRQLASEAPSDRRYNFDKFSYHDRVGLVSISPEVFQAASELITAKGLSPDRIQSAYDDLYAAGEPNEEVNAAKTLTGILHELSPIYEDAKQKKDELYASLGEGAEQRLQTVELLMQAERRVSKALMDVTRANTGWTSQTWVALLVIRIGTVILLLYLTSVLLSTYRYTLTLAAYYTARADALQLLSRQPLSRVVDVKELQALIPMLSPDDYRIDQPPVPYETLGKAARTGASGQ
jgi:hypothetical protein